MRVTFNYVVDYYFAVTHAALSLQQNVSLPNNVLPQIQGRAWSARSIAIRRSARLAPSAIVAAREDWLT
jgi:hypothetical protein